MTYPCADQEVLSMTTFFFLFSFKFFLFFLFVFIIIILVDEGEDKPNTTISDHRHAIFGVSLTCR